MILTFSPVEQTLLHTFIWTLKLRSQQTQFAHQIGVGCLSLDREFAARRSSKNVFISLDGWKLRMRTARSILHVGFVRHTVIESLSTSHAQSWDPDFWTLDMPQRSNYTAVRRLRRTRRSKCAAGTLMLSVRWLWIETGHAHWIRCESNFTNEATHKLGMWCTFNNARNTGTSMSQGPWCSRWTSREELIV